MFKVGDKVKILNKSILSDMESSVVCKDGGGIAYYNGVTTWHGQTIHLLVTKPREEDGGDYFLDGDFILLERPLSEAVDL